MGKKIKKSVSFNLKPEIETCDNSKGKPKKVVKKTVKKIVQRRVRQPYEQKIQKFHEFHLKKNDEKDQTELEIVVVGEKEASDAATQDIATEDLKLSEKVEQNRKYWFYQIIFE